MTPKRRETINGHTVEEYWWAGDYVVYVDGVRNQNSFATTCARLRTQPNAKPQDQSRGNKGRLLSKAGGE